MEQYDLIVNQPVVIDNGSGVIKAGFAGDQVPKCHFPNYIGRPKHTRVMAGALEGDLFVGPKAQEHRGLLSIRNPMEHGIVTGKSLSEALLFAEHGDNMLCTKMSETISVRNMFSPGLSLEFSCIELVIQ